MQAASPQDPTREGAFAATATVDKEAYVAEIKLLGECEAKKPCTALVSLQTKGEYKLIKDFDLSFQTKNPAPKGVKYAKSTLTRKDGEFDERGGTFKLVFTSSGAGKVNLGGTLSFKLTDAQGVALTGGPIEKPDFDLDVEAK